MKPNILLFILLALLSQHLRADNALDHLLNAREAPEGVVFEVVESDDDALVWAVPLIRGYVQQLRARFPGIEIAVVSHGSEQFALTSANRKQNEKMHEGVRSLVQDASVPVHVCGTHAGWYGVSPEDFPDYVDVAVTGPAQIRLYKELGYELVIVDRPN